MPPVKVEAGPSKRQIGHSEGDQRAPQVCSHCKSIKKGCDKRLPRCSQCIKRHAVCRYGEISSPRRLGDEVVNASPASSSSSNLTSIPRSVLGRLDPKIRLSILLRNSVSEIMQTGVLEPNGPPPISTDGIFYSQVSHIIRTDGHSVEEVVAKYFAGVHSWLPILSKKRFYDRFRASHTAPAADFSILLLVLHLITQHPSLDRDVDQDREIVYLATKTLFTQVQAFIPTSLRLVQAAVIIARYEQAHGMIEAAYITVGTCARMAFAIEINNVRCSEVLQGTDTWFDEEESLSTWWGLVICDRIISSDYRVSGRPLATGSIRDDDYLPLEAVDLAGDVTPAEPKYRYFVSATSLPSVGEYGREVQATYLLAKVRQADVQNNFSEEIVMSLGRELQGLLSTVMDLTEGRGCYCDATKTLIRAMYNLHWSALNSQGIFMEPNGAQSIQVTLDTLTRMVIDIAYAFNAEIGTCNIETLSPAVTHIADCAQQYIRTCKDFRNEQWLSDFEELRKMLRFFGGRWLLAEQQLGIVNKSFETAMGIRSRSRESSTKRQHDIAFRSPPRP